MANLQVASKYAQSLLQLAIKKEMLEPVYTDMVAFTRLCKDHSMLLGTLQSPIISNQKKWDVLQKLFANQVSSLVLRFFEIVVQKNRESLLLDMASCFTTQYDDYKNIKTAHITTAMALSDGFTEQFRKLVQNIAPCQEVKFVQHINPAILGGFILQVDDKRLDESLLNKLRLVEKQCITSGYE
jgi:F-type H+-transporting ATPase subunit delta